MENVLKSVVVVSSLLFAGVTNAATTTWEWDLNGSVGNDGDKTLSTAGTSATDSGNLDVTLSGYADTGSASDNKLRKGDFYYYGDDFGWGLVNKDEDEDFVPDHAFDNQAGTYSCDRGYTLGDGICTKSGYRSRSPYLTPDASEFDYDMSLISFDTSVALTGINFGWVSDGDFTLLAYNGTTPFVEADLGGSTWSDQQSSGNWLTVGQYNGGLTDAYYTVNSTNISSQYWLLGAYNSLFGESPHRWVDKNDDAFKIRKLRGDISTPTAEVSSPAAFGLLLLGAAFAYRRRNQHS